MQSPDRAVCPFCGSDADTDHIAGSTFMCWRCRKPFTLPQKPVFVLEGPWEDTPASALRRTLDELWDRPVPETEEALRAHIRTVRGAAHTARMLKETVFCETLYKRCLELTAVLNERWPTNENADFHMKLCYMASMDLAACDAEPSVIWMKYAQLGIGTARGLYNAAGTEAEKEYYMAFLGALEGAAIP